MIISGTERSYSMIKILCYYCVRVKCDIDENFSSWIFVWILKTDLQFSLFLSFLLFFRPSIRSRMQIIDMYCHGDRRCCVVKCCHHGGHRAGGTGSCQYSRPWIPLTDAEHKMCEWHRRRVECGVRMLSENKSRLKTAVGYAHPLSCALLWPLLRMNLYRVSVRIYFLRSFFWFTHISPFLHFSLLLLFSFFLSHILVLHRTSRRTGLHADY